MTYNISVIDLHHTTNLNQFLQLRTTVAKRKSMTAIITVDEPVKVLKSCAESDPYMLNVMNNVKIPREEFERYYFWNDDKYTRNVSARNSDFEVLLICREEGQSYPIHDCNAQEAWVHP